jgi:SWIM zinc finger
MNATRTRRRVLPVRLEEATVLSRAICVCEMIPAGVPGLVSINGATYTLALNATLPEVGEPIIHGYRLTSMESYKSYDLPADLSTCDCPDWYFRRNTVEHPCCKHQLAVRQFREQGKLA